MGCLFRVTGCKFHQLGARGSVPACRLQRSGGRGSVRAGFIHLGRVSVLASRYWVARFGLRVARFTDQEGEAPSEPFSGKIGSARLCPSPMNRTQQSMPLVQSASLALYSFSRRGETVVTTPAFPLYDTHGNMVATLTKNASSTSWNVLYERSGGAFLECDVRVKGAVLRQLGVRR
jgi:hypothetical protein